MHLLKKINLFLLLFSSAVFAAPKDDFANVLKYAKFSSCEDIAYKFETLSRFDGFGKLVEKELNIKKENLFPWQFEVTNGYKEGFFYYALLGYANEQSGDIPFAYQCYRNATLYIDEEKSFNSPEPTAEIYLGIARTCLAAGRYMDAKDWLDTAYEYANENPNILAAIDRVAIQKGNELGDYENIILHYQHLMSIANDIKSPPFKGDLGGCKLTKPEIANYSQILFWSRKDREGFSKLLEGISKLGIDNNLGVKDLLVNKFLNNIMRADDEEVEYFYDLLGYEIETARAKAGDEKYFAFLCNARTLFCKVYNFLSSEEDLKKVKNRIDKVKEQLKQGYDVFGQKKYSVFGNQYSGGKKKKNRKSQNRKLSKTGKIEELPEVELENLLMQADWYYKIKKYVIAKVMYDKTTILATGIFANLEYDGTTTKNAAMISAIKCALQLNSQFIIHNSQFNFDSSFRAAELILRLYQTATNDEQCAKYDTESAIVILPRAHPMVLKFMRKEISKHFRKLETEKAIEYSKKYKFYDWLSWIFAAQFKTEKSFSAMLNNVRYADGYNDRSSKLVMANTHWSWATDNDLVDYEKLLKISLIQPLLVYYNKKSKFGNLVFDYNYAMNWHEKSGKHESNLRQKISNQNYCEALSIITNYFSKSESQGKNFKVTYNNISNQFYNLSTNIFNGTMQAGHELKKAQLLLNLNLTNDAYKAVINAYECRCHTFCNFNADIFYPTLESKIIENCLLALGNTKIKTHINWLKNKRKKYKKQNAESYVTILDEKIIYFNKKLEQK